MPFLGFCFNSSKPIWLPKDKGTLEMLDKRSFYINGQWVGPVDGRDFEVTDPSTEAVIGHISLGGKADTDAAVAAAKEAFKFWQMTTKDERLTLCRRIHDVYMRRSEDMAVAIATEMGAPIDMSRVQQVGAGSFHMDGFFAAAKDWEPVQKLGDHAPNDRVLYDPVGVCALITPWNWPMNQIVLKVFPALIAGNTMVLKPSEIAPLSGHLWAEIMDEAGTPAGVFNLINGDGPGVGTQLSTHPDVHMVSFTGSTRAGIAISKNAAETLKRVSLELGGKGANILFADARPEAAKWSAMRVFNNSGQSCNAPTRLLVERSRYDQTIEEIKIVAENLAVDSAHAEGKHIGPVVSKAQYDKIQGLIETGIKDGARLVAGGLGRPEPHKQGYFVQPTVFADVDNEATISREEIFGPVFCIMPFDSEEEAIEIANDTAYGLTNFIQTEDKNKLKRVAKRLRSGMVENNGIGRGMGSPFGGMKGSGNGREGGIWGIEDFCEIKSVSDWVD